MPQRTWGGSSGSSSGSSGSSSSSSSSGSSSSWRSSRRYSDDGGGSGEPADPMMTIIWIGILLLLIIAPGILESMRTSSERRRDQDATATTRAITQADLKLMRDAVDPRLDDWQRTARGTRAEWLNASDAGFPRGSNTRGVMYGYCAPAETFYIYVLNISTPQHYAADVEGYAYTPGTTPRSCSPPGWRVYDYVSAEAPGWYFMIADSEGDRLTATPLPTAVFRS